MKCFRCDGPALPDGRGGQKQGQRTSPTRLLLTSCRPFHLARLATSVRTSLIPICYDFLLLRWSDEGTGSDAAAANHRTRQPSFVIFVTGTKVWAATKMWNTKRRRPVTCHQETSQRARETNNQLSVFTRTFYTAVRTNT